MKKLFISWIYIDKAKLEKEAAKVKKKCVTANVKRNGSYFTFPHLCIKHERLY